MTPTPHRHAHALPEDPDAPASQEADQERRSTRTMALRAGLAALALSVAVSGGAYAAVRVGQNGSSSDTANQHADILGAEGGRSGVSVTPSAQKVTTETVDATDPHGTVQQESSDLPQGETKVATPGVDGVVRTTYEITTVGGKEVSRTPIAQVVVTQKVDEVVLVGTGAAKKQEQPQSQEQTPAPSAPSDSSGSSGGSGSSGSSGGSADSGGSASGGSAGTTGGDVGDDVWAKLAQCESGGNPQTKYRQWLLRHVPVHPGDLAGPGRNRLPARGRCRDPDRHGQEASGSVRLGPVARLRRQARPALRRRSGPRDLRGATDHAGSMRRVPR